MDQNPPRRRTILQSQVHKSNNSNRRSTLGTSSQSTLKTRQLSHLNVQLAKLQANMADMDNLLKITAFQADSMRRLGIMHASLYVFILFYLLISFPLLAPKDIDSISVLTFYIYRFMAGHKFFEEEAVRQQQETEAKNQTAQDTQTHNSDKDRA